MNKYYKVVCDKRLASNEKIVLIFLLENIKNYKTTTLCVTYKTMKDKLNLSSPTVMKAIEGLQAKGIIEKSKTLALTGIHKENRYKIICKDYIE